MCWHQPRQIVAGAWHACLQLPAEAQAEASTQLRCSLAPDLRSSCMRHADEAAFEPQSESASKGSLNYAQALQHMACPEEVLCAESAAE